MVIMVMRGCLIRYDGMGWWEKGARKLELESEGGREGGRVGIQDMSEYEI